MLHLFYENECLNCIKYFEQNYGEYAEKDEIAERTAMLERTT